MSIICNQVEHDEISKARGVELAKRHAPARVAAARAKVAEAVNPSGPVAEAAKGLSRRGKAGIALAATAAGGAAGAGGVALARRRRPETVAVAKNAGPFGVAKADAATRRANDLARGGLARPGGSPAKGTARIEDVRAAARLKGKNLARVATRVKP